MNINECSIDKQINKVDDYSNCDINITLTEDNHSYLENHSYNNIELINGIIEDKNSNIEFKYCTGRWTTEEHNKFIEAMFLYGNEWKRVQQHIGTRSSTQARSHAQKFFIRLKKKLLEDNFSGDLKDKSINNRNEIIMSWIQENVNSDIIYKMTNKYDNLYTEKRDKLCKIIFNLLTNPIKKKTPKITTIKNCCGINGTNMKNCEQVCCIYESDIIKEYERNRKKSNISINSLDDNEIFKIEKINKDMTPSTTNNNFLMKQADYPYINQNNYINIVTINLCKDEKEINKKDEDNHNPFKLNFCESPIIKTDDNNEMNLNFDLNYFFKVDNFLN